ncbi:hypothetical protein COV11_03480, partial [Candidatus Woesearchaeota archaeon CG10_big_fil_rev_8_21_14_0_10_30_7]
MNLDSKLKNYKKQVYVANLSVGTTESFCNALDRARKGNVYYKNYLNEAKSSFGFRRFLPSSVCGRLVTLVNNLFEEALPVEGIKQVNYWLDAALNEAEEGIAGLCGYETSLRIAQKQAKSIGIQILPEEINKIHQAYLNFQEN